ncbi:MAG: glycosyl transferase family 2, partial [Marinilabiliales bacterium]
MIAVVIPCYKVKDQIVEVIGSIGEVVDKIYVIDDCCPHNTGNYVLDICTDLRVEVVFHKENGGVGAAVKTGYKKALKDGAEYIIKLDGDGQMDASLIPDIIRPLKKLKADYVKGNRFYELKYLRTMPRLRLIGNSMLSLINKFSSGYWNIMDPTNGFTAINSRALRMLPLTKIDDGYFFESDMLFRLGTIRAVTTEIPMSANYGQEDSSLNIKKILLEFPCKYFNRFIKRLTYNYFLRD